MSVLCWGTVGRMYNDGWNEDYIIQQTAQYYSDQSQKSDTC